MSVKLLLILTVLLLWMACQSNTQNSAIDFLPKENTNTSISADYEGSNRDIWQQPDAILNLLAPLDSLTIVDIGAGSGFFSLRLLPRAKKVIAVDIDPQAIRRLDSLKISLPETLHTKLEPRLAQPDNPYLRPNEADAVLMVNTYMYLQNRVAYLNTLKHGIRANGKLLIVDFKDKSTAVGPDPSKRIPQGLVEQELKTAGFQIIKSDDITLNFQYIIIALKI